jgi:hypothetical protein
LAFSFAFAFAFSFAFEFSLLLVLAIAGDRAEPGTQNENRTANHTGTPNLHPER